MRITPRKGEVDYQGVHAKARPGFDDDEEEDDNDAYDDEDIMPIFRHHTIVGIFEHCCGH